MDQLKEQLKKHYENVQPSEGFLQKLHTLEAPEPAPVPVRMSWKRLLTPIAAMLIAAVAILGGGKHLMDMEPPTAVPPEIAVESAVGFDDICYGEADAPTSVPECNSAAQVDPEPGSVPESPPEKTAPEPGSADVTAPQIPTSPEPTDPVPPSGETTDPVPPEDITDPVPPPSQPPIEVEGPGDDPTPPPEDDVPPTTPGDDDPPYDPGDDDPPTDPGENDPVDPPDDPLGPDVAGPADEPDEPINPESPPEISGFYKNTNGQHMVVLTNWDTNEIKILDLTSVDSIYSYRGIHNAFGYMVEVALYFDFPGFETSDNPHLSSQFSCNVVVKVIGVA